MKTISAVKRFFFLKIFVLCWPFSKSLLNGLQFCFYFMFFVFLTMRHALEAQWKEFACNAGDTGSIPGSGRPSGEGNGNLLQYSCLENPMDRGAWQVAVYGVTKSLTWLSDWACKHKACEVLATRSRFEPTSPSLEDEVLITGPPGKSLFLFFFSIEV